MQPHWGTVAATTAVIIAVEALVALTLLGTRPWPVSPQMHFQDRSGGSPSGLGGLGANSRCRPLSDRLNFAPPQMLIEPLVVIIAKARDPEP